MDNNNNNFCQNCGNKIDINAKFCANCGNGINNNVASSPSPATHQYNSSRLCCPNCGSNNIQVQIVSENKNVGCGTILLCAIFAWTIIGLIILISLLSNNTVNRKYYVCQSCGKTFRPAHSNSSEDNPIRTIIATIIVVFGSILLLFLMAK